MRYGLIYKTAVTPAKVCDFKSTDSICPKQGLVFTDKLFDCKTADLAIKAKGCFAATIRKKNNKTKNPDLDRWRSQIRMPFEGTFSKLRKRARFKGLAKVFFQCTFESICHNLKKAIAILPLQLAPQGAQGWTASKFLK